MFNDKASAFPAGQENTQPYTESHAVSDLSGTAKESEDSRYVEGHNGQRETADNPTHNKYEYSSSEKKLGPEFSGGTSEGGSTTDIPPAASYGKDGYNAYGFNANGSGGGYGQTANRFSQSYAIHQSAVRPAGRKRMLTAACVLFTCSLVVFAFSFAILFASYEQLNLVSGSNDAPAISESKTNLWVNPENIDYGDAFSNASAMTVNSVVVITATSSSTTSRASGVIWSSGNDITYILTCYHVIEDSDEIKVTLNDDSTYRAELVGVDAKTDLAVLSIDASDLPSIVLPSSDSELVLGQSVIAIGNALGTLSNSITNGIISSLERTVTVDGVSMELLQTSAAVNSGNSGGGLFDLNGQLIGIVNAKKAGATVEGIGFAIPFDVCREVATQIISQGYVSGRPYIGVQTVTISDAASWMAAMAKYPDLESYTSKLYAPQSYYYIEGVYVVGTDETLEYAQGSDTLEFGDRIISIGGTSVNDDADIISTVITHEAGDTIEITVMRNGRTVVVDVILAQAGK